MQSKISTSDQTSCQRFIDMSLCELNAELAEKYAKIVSAEYFLYVETKLSCHTRYHGSTTKRDDRIKMVCNMLEYNQAEDKLDKLIKAYKLEFSYNLYINEREIWDKLQSNLINNTTPQNIRKSHLMVVS